MCFWTAAQHRYDMLWQTVRKTSCGDQKGLQGFPYTIPTHPKFGYTPPYHPLAIKFAGIWGKQRGEYKPQIKLNKTNSDCESINLSTKEATLTIHHLVQNCSRCLKNYCFKHKNLIGFRGALSPDLPLALCSLDSR